MPVVNFRLSLLLIGFHRYKFCLKPSLCLRPQAVGGLGRKGNFQTKAPKADRKGLHLRSFFVRIFRVDYIFGVTDNVLVYITTY